MIVAADEFRVGIFPSRYAATVRADINDVAEIDADWQYTVGWLRNWTEKRDGKISDVNLIFLADRVLHPRIISVIKADLPPKESEFAVLVREFPVRLTVFDHDGDAAFDWTHPIADSGT